jgi:hypothetical protein
LRGIILDTNVVSEPKRARPDASVVAIATATRMVSRPSARR